MKKVVVYSQKVLTDLERFQVGPNVPTIQPSSSSFFIDDGRWVINGRVRMLCPGDLRRNCEHREKPSLNEIPIVIMGAGPVFRSVQAIRVAKMAPGMDSATWSVHLLWTSEEPFAVVIAENRIGPFFKPIRSYLAKQVRGGELGRYAPTPRFVERFTSAGVCEPDRQWCRLAELAGYLRVTPFEVTQLFLTIPGEHETKRPVLVFARDDEALENGDFEVDPRIEGDVREAYRGKDQRAPRNLYVALGTARRLLRLHAAGLKRGTETLGLIEQS